MQQAAFGEAAENKIRFWEFSKTVSRGGGVGGPKS